MFRRIECDILYLQVNANTIIYKFVSDNEIAIDISNFIELVWSWNIIKE